MHGIDPDHLPETTGVVDCFLLNAEGEADGLVLNDGTEVHFPPHMGNDVLVTVRPGSTALVRAKVLGDAPMISVEMRADGGKWMPMRPVPGDTALWDASGPANVRHVTVRARDAKDCLGEDQIEPAGDRWTPPKRQADGSDADRLEAWPERGIFGTQLGPNRNGRKW